MAKVLIACEFSGVVRDAFRTRGHDAWSCDLLPCESDEKWHLKGDVFEWIENPPMGEPFDLMIAHPPCTYLTATANRWLNIAMYGQKAIDRIFARHDALGFVLKLYYSKIPHVAIENPVGYLSSAFRKPDQIIQPYYFGDEFQKTTCLWLKDLPLLDHNDIPGLFNEKTTWVDRGEMVTFASGKTMPKWYADARGNGHLRSRTFQGIANAMAEQWGSLLPSHAFTI